MTTLEMFSSQDEYESVHSSTSEDVNNLFVETGSKSRKSDTLVKCCFENQRYWMLGGWSAMMGGALERASWSDAKGLVHLPKKRVKLEKGWRWASNW